MKEQIKSLLLSAGFGTRLRPLTLTTPKCLVPIGNTPMLEDWLQKLEKVNCSETLVNTHYLAAQVQDYLSRRRKSNMQIKIVYEPELLGTGGTLLSNLEYFDTDIGIIIHADNATDFELGELIEAHNQRPSECLLTMLTFTTDSPQNCGIIEKNQSNIVTAFHEKQKYPKGNEANAAVYVFSQEFIKTIKQLDGTMNDISTQILPRLMNRIYAYHTNSPYLDIGTPTALKTAQEIWSRKK